MSMSLEVFEESLQEKPDEVDPLAFSDAERALLGEHLPTESTIIREEQISCLRAQLTTVASTAELLEEEREELHCEAESWHLRALDLDKRNQELRSQIAQLQAQMRSQMSPSADVIFEDPSTVKLQAKVVKLEAERESLRVELDTHESDKMESIEKMEMLSFELEAERLLVSKSDDMNAELEATVEAQREELEQLSQELVAATQEQEFVEWKIQCKQQQMSAATTKHAPKDTVILSTDAVQSLATVPPMKAPALGGTHTRASAWRKVYAKPPMSSSRFSTISSNRTTEYRSDTDTEDAEMSHLRMGTVITGGPQMGHTSLDACALGAGDDDSRVLYEDADDFGFDEKVEDTFGVDEKVEDSAADTVVDSGKLPVEDLEEERSEEIEELKAELLLWKQKCEQMEEETTVTALRRSSEESKKKRKQGEYEEVLDSDASGDAETDAMDTTVPTRTERTSAGLPHFDEESGSCVVCNFKIW